MKLTFLHISDLHIEKKYLPDIKIVLNAFWEDIRKMNKNIDLIFFNGDLIKHGNLGLKEEYELAREQFIEPLLHLSGVSKDHMFFVPGNHEVNRNKINLLIDGDITSKFKDRETLNYFIDNLGQNEQLLTRLDDYNTFIDSIENKHIKSRNKLYSTYCVNFGEKKIGIACLNTAWSSFGGEEDYGKILLGERQVDNVIIDLENCDLKILMFHHPLEWLKEFDRESVFDRIITNFDIVLTGHLHSQNFKQIVFNNFKATFIKSASLFQGRTINGYSFIEYDSETQELDIYFREYFEGGRRAFGKAERIAEDGHVNLILQKNDHIDLLKKT